MVRTDAPGTNILKLPDSDELLGIDLFNHPYAIPAASVCRHPVCQWRVRRFLRRLPLPPVFPLSVTAVKKAIKPLYTFKPKAIKDYPTVKTAFSGSKITFDPGLGAPEGDKKHMTEENPAYDFHPRFSEVVEGIVNAIDNTQDSEQKSEILNKYLKMKITKYADSSKLTQFILEFLYALFLYRDEPDLAVIVKPVLVQELEHWMTSRSEQNKRDNLATENIPDKSRQLLLWLKGLSNLRTKAGFLLLSEVYDEWVKSHESDTRHLCYAESQKPQAPAAPTRDQIKEQKATSYLPESGPCFEEIHPLPEREEEPDPSSTAPHPMNHPTCYQPGFEFPARLTKKRGESLYSGFVGSSNMSWSFHSKQPSLLLPILI